MKLTIGHLYPDLLNLYGDRGNIQCLMRRCQWRGIEAETIAFELGDKIDFSRLDIVLLGGGSDREQMLVCEKLKEIQPDFKKYVEDGGVVIAICGGYQLLGKYYKTDQGTITGLDLVDLYTEQGEGRLISNIVLKSDLFDMPVDLRTMEEEPVLITASLWEKYSMDLEMMEKQAMRVWFTRM
jgi:CobQ-like glutamine amidotransferase family enzyme